MISTEPVEPFPSSVTPGPENIPPAVLANKLTVSPIHGALSVRVKHASKAVPS